MIRIKYGLTYVTQDSEQLLSFILCRKSVFVSVY
uniref:Uncharacterized protein n=1 Tax=Lepeophtheirus salmonis TaxID=72036 RepID=A0A0K2URA1_LEPSM